MEKDTPRPCSGQVPRIFLTLNGAIARAYQDGDEYTGDLLMVAKMAAVRYHYDRLEGR